MKIVTSGKTFLDIDAYGGCVAYAELLNIQGEKAVAFSSAPLNESITTTARSWNVAFSDDYEAATEDTYILIDVSEPEFIEKTADIERVEEVIDHHVGYEDFWRERIGDKTDIEFIGAACTQVYERWEKAGLLIKMSKESAGLLVSGILDNTLNFKAGVTTDRDRTAFANLLKIAGLDEQWAAQYFTECQDTILGDLRNALINDTKLMGFQKLSVERIAFGQLVVWDAGQIVAEHMDDIQVTMAALSDAWFVNLVSIKEGRSYFLTNDSVVRDWAESILCVAFEGNIAEAERLWLRKEIVKQDLS